MIEICEKDGQKFLVTDDKDAEGIQVADALELSTPDLKQRWDATKMEDGEIAMPINPEDYVALRDAFEGAEEFCIMVLAEEFDALIS